MQLYCYLMTKLQLRNNYDPSFLHFWFYPVAITLLPWTKKDGLEETNSLVFYQNLQMIISNIFYRMYFGFYFNDTVGISQHFFHNPYQQWMLKMHFTKVPRYTALFSHLKIRSLTCLSDNNKKRQKPGR